MILCSNGPPYYDNGRRKFSKKYDRPCVMIRTSQINTCQTQYETLNADTKTGLFDGESISIWWAAFCQLVAQVGVMWYDLQNVTEITLTIKISCLSSTITSNYKTKIYGASQTNKNIISLLTWSQVLTTMISYNLQPESPIANNYLALTHWGRVTHICVSKLTIIGSDNGLSPDRRQAIIWNNAGILLIGPLGTISVKS